MPPAVPISPFFFAWRQSESRKDNLKKLYKSLEMIQPFVSLSDGQRSLCFTIDTMIIEPCAETKSDFLTLTL